MTPEATKEEVKLHTEIIKFLMVTLLATSGGLVTLYNVDKTSHVQQVLITLGLIFSVLLLIGIVALFCTFILC